MMGDQPPAKAIGLGGRQVRTDPLFGHIFDHHAVCYEYDNGVRVLFLIAGKWRAVRATSRTTFFGSNGQCKVLKHEIKTRDGDRWRYRGKKRSMYRVEHEELFAGIRNGEHINNGDYMAKSTLMAIMGRMATYTGQAVTWDQALNSEERLGPETYGWGDVEFADVAIPGVTPLV